MEKSAGIPLFVFAVIAILSYQTYTTVSAASINVAAADDVFWSIAAQSSRVVISAGDTVVWTNTGSSRHNVTADDRGWSSPNMVRGGRYSRTFPTPGEFPYRCTLHEVEEMYGIVVVQAPVIPMSGNRIILPATKP